MDSLTLLAHQADAPPPVDAAAPPGERGDPPCQDADAGGGGGGTSLTRKGAAWTEAAERVGAYFASLGLTDGPRREAVVADVLTRINPTGTHATIVRRAVDEAVESVDAWIDDVVVRAAAQTPMLSRAAAPRRVLAWKLRPLLAAHPEGFLARADLPDLFVQALRQALVPVLPEALPVPMPTQQLKFCSLLPDANWSTRLRRGAREKFDALLAAMDGS